MRGDGAHDSGSQTPPSLQIKDADDADNGDGAWNGNRHWLRAFSIPIND